MSAVPSPVAQVFSYSSFYDETEKLSGTNTYKNISNVLGYIPGVSIISGLARIIFATYMLHITPENNTDAIAFYKIHLIRGFMEVSSTCGIALLILDLYFTLGKKDSDKNLSINDKSILQTNTLSNVEYRPSAVYRDFLGKVIPSWSTIYRNKHVNRPIFDIAGWRRCRPPTREKTVTDSPCSIIKQNTTPNEFYLMCKNYPYYNLQQVFVDNINNTVYRPALILAALKENENLFYALLKDAPKLADIIDTSSQTALHHICRYSDHELAVRMATVLIEEYNVDINAFHSPNEGMKLTPLHIAAMHSNEKLVQLLLKHEAVLILNDTLYDSKSPIPTPFELPQIYRLKSDQVNFINDQFGKFLLHETIKKGMPLREYALTNHIPNDIVGFILKLFYSSFPLKFW